MLGRSPLAEDGIWHPQFAITQSQANALAAGRDPADVCHPMQDGRVNLLIRLNLPKDFKVEGHDPDGAGREPLGDFFRWPDVGKYFIRSAKVFGLGDLFREFGDIATSKELYDIWMTCRIIANRRKHSRNREGAGLWQPVGEGKGKKGKGEGKKGKGKTGKGEGKKGKGKKGKGTGTGAGLWQQEASEA